MSEMGKGSDSLSEGVSMASKSKSSFVSSSSGEGERKAEGKSPETSDSLRPDDQHVISSHNYTTKTHLVLETQQPHLELAWH